MTRGFATFSDASGALSVVAPAGWQLGQLTFEGGPGIVVADGDPQTFRDQELELTISGTTFVASPSLPARLGIFDARDKWFVPLMDWVTSEIGFFGDASGSYGGGETWHRGSEVNGGALYGVSRIWHGCGRAGRTMRDLAMIPADAAFVAYLRVVNLPSEEEIADSIAHGFEVDAGALAPFAARRTMEWGSGSRGLAAPKQSRRPPEPRGGEVPDERDHTPHRPGHQPGRKPVAGAEPHSSAA
jgi:hypothetical protein